MAIRPDVPEGSGRFSDRDLHWVVSELTLSVLLGLFLIQLYGPPGRWQAMLWSLAFLEAGFLIGFLFGIPRVLQSDEKPKASASSGPGFGASLANPYGLAINTNLEQVSDWLTKILVGVSLVELRSLGSNIQSVAAYIAPGLGCQVNNTAGCERLAAGITIYFSCVGLLNGYLITRIFFSGAFRRADEYTAGVRREQQKVLAEAFKGQDEQAETGEPAFRDLEGTEEEAAREVAKLSLRDVASDSRALQAWSRAQMAVDAYEKAIQGYRLLLDRTPNNPRIRYEYAIALKYAAPQNLPDVCVQLEQARKDARSDTDRLLRRQIYTSLTYNCLYLPKPYGFMKTIEFGEEYVNSHGNEPSSSVWVNLACAYGQKARWLRSNNGTEQEFSQGREKALHAVKEASRLSEASKMRLRELLDLGPAVVAAGDDDLQVFGNDNDFRKVVGLPPSSKQPPAE